MSYTPEQLAVLDPAAISKTSQRHIQSVIEELIETVTAERAENEALKGRLVRAEREACAKVCDELADTLWDKGLSTTTGPAKCASAIRARGAQ